MSTVGWLLQGNPIPAPSKTQIKNDVQKVTRRVLDGSYSRDYIGSEKKVFECEYDFISAADYDFIKGQYDEQRLYGTAKTLAITKTGLTFSGSVIIDFQDMGLPIPNHYNYRSVKINYYEV